MYITRIENVIQEISIPSVGRTECWKFQSKKGGEGYIYIGKYPENNMNHNGEGGGLKPVETIHERGYWSGVILEKELKMNI